jgi:hypothetical protein
MMRPLILLLLDPGQHLAETLEVCAESGNVQTAVKMVMDIEDPTHQANRMLSAALLIRNELLDEGLD